MYFTVYGYCADRKLKIGNVVLPENPVRRNCCIWMSVGNIGKDMKECKSLC